MSAGWRGIGICPFPSPTNTAIHITYIDLASPSHVDATHCFTISKEGVRERHAVVRALGKIVHTNEQMPHKIEKYAMVDNMFE